MWITHFRLRELYNNQTAWNFLNAVKYPYPCCLRADSGRHRRHFEWQVVMASILYHSTNTSLSVSDTGTIILCSRPREEFKDLQCVSQSLLSLEDDQEHNGRILHVSRDRKKRGKTAFWLLGRIQAAKWRATDPRATVLREQQGIILRGGLCFLVMGKYIFWGHPDRKPL